MLTVQFLDSENPEDEKRLQFGTQGEALQAAMWDFEQQLRGIWKYRESDEGAVDAIWDAWHECIHEHGVNIHD